MDEAKTKRKRTMLKTILFMSGFLRKVGLGFIVKKATKPITDLFGGRVTVLVSAGATLKPKIRKFYERLGFVVGDCYGLTETTGPSNFNFKFKLANGKTTWAGPLPGNEIEIHAPDKNGIGEVRVSGNLVMQGYVDNPTANAEAFEGKWFKTGDLGTIDKRGRLTIKGRKKQIIVLESGKKVFPDELEELYLTNDEILQAAVFERKVNNKIVPFAVFQVAPGTTAAQVRKLLQLSNLGIAPYKWVHNFAITEDELPMTSAKKIQHFKVAKMLDNGELKPMNRNNIQCFNSVA